MTNALILMDIDGTLIDTKGAGVQPFKDAIKLVTGFSIEFERDKFRGQTDHMIAKALLKQKEMSTPENVQTVLRNYENGLRIALQNQPAVSLPGVIEVLEYLNSQTGIQVVAATGNTELGLKWKLQSAQIDHLLVNHYFSTSTDFKRSQILLRAKKDYPNTNRVIVVGDTHHDATASQEIDSEFAAVTSIYYTTINAINDKANYFVPHPWDKSSFTRMLT